MPSRKPRLILTLPPELKDDLHALAVAIDKPMSTALVELLTMIQPQIQDLTKLATHAKAGRTAAVRRSLQHMVGNAMAEIISAHQPDLFKAKRK